ncbi:HipA family kinase [Gracilimonas mengyeensis]|uniref:HipA-like kinase domain-containing protein n=1 Tax=Gracilimonas mengyeensis TaxID=1302730 RepID=A0A521BMP7_9BACT|nr:HipA family kinase [Gracilimonas mengyeensis]SMO48385.1 hypothetical protein SAMN06265219_102404 [Gracilimonas mengyeensis]
MAKKENYISIIAVLEVLTTGDDPIKVLAEDEHVYLIKHNIRGNKFPDMAREWICYRLFKHFKVSIPKADLLRFNPMMFQDEIIGLTGRFKEHIVFGSRWLQSRDELKDEFYAGRNDKKEKLVNPSELARILVMDLWLKNSDRQSLNLNMIVSKQKLYAIDHSATFDQEFLSRLAEPDKKEYFVQPGEVGDLIINSHYFKYYFKQYPKEFEQAGIALCRKIAGTDRTFLNKILSTLPESWQISTEEKQAIAEYLMFRKSKLEKLFIEHLNFGRK